MNLVPPLLATDTRLSDAGIEGVYQTNYQGLKQLFALVDNPPVAVTDPVRLSSVRTVLGGLLELLDRSGVPSEREDRILRTNLMYDALILSLDTIKRSLDMPSVPKGRPAK
ncbi:MAG: hypothetical protein L3K13_08015 [Thermoplasmata archaeon]|nr:hypothetical protein [Thermoplasmata archaeon]